MNTSPSFPTLLREGVWHVTSTERFALIRSAGQLLPEPDIPNRDRWCTGCGPEHYPYVRHLGGISLFDFSCFDDATYNDQYANSQWRNFVPCPVRWKTAVWVQFSEGSLGHNYIAPGKLIDRWRAESSFGHNIMPLIEAAYIGPLDLGLAQAVWKISGDAWSQWA